MMFLSTCCIFDFEHRGKAGERRGCVRGGESFAIRGAEGALQQQHRARRFGSVGASCSSSSSSAAVQIATRARGLRVPLGAQSSPPPGLVVDELSAVRCMRSVPTTAIRSPVVQSASAVSICSDRLIHTADKCVQPILERGRVTRPAIPPRSGTTRGAGARHQNRRLLFRSARLSMRSSFVAPSTVTQPVCSDRCSDAAQRVECPM